MLGHILSTNPRVIMLFFMRYVSTTFSILSMLNCLYSRTFGNLQFIYTSSSSNTVLFYKKFLYLTILVLRGTFNAKVHKKVQFLWLYRYCLLFQKNCVRRGPPVQVEVEKPQLSTNSTPSNLK